MTQCLTLHTNIRWPSQGPSKLLNWIFCNAYLFVFINKNLLISCYISMITKLSSDDEPSFKMLFRNRFLSMIDYATNYCTSVRALNSFRAQQDVQWHLEESSFKIIIIIFTHRLASGSRSGLQNAVFIEENFFKYIIKDVYMHVVQWISTFSELHDCLKIN